MKTKNLIKILRILSLIFYLLIGHDIEAQDFKPDLNDFIADLQKSLGGANEIKFIFWIPPEYWEIVLPQDPSVTQEVIDQINEVLKPYNILAVVQGDIGAFGGVTYKSKDYISSYLKIIDAEYREYYFINESGIDTDVKNFLEMLKPVFVNMLGSMGQNMHLFLFPAKNEDGTAIADIKKKGIFKVYLEGEILKWRLPLSSLLPPKYCRTCDEKLNGGFIYCPYCGKKLE